MEASRETDVAVTTTSTAGGDRTLLRLLKPIPLFVGDDNRLGWRAFRPTKTDLTVSPVRVSVWDTKRTTLAQALAFRGSAVPAPQPWHVQETAIAEIAQAEAWPGLRVVDDPQKELEGAGADGHCGIEGLEQGELAEAEHKRRLTLVAMAATPG